MSFASNINAFKAAASHVDASDLVKAYCGLVAIELALKGGGHTINSHDVPSALLRVLNGNHQKNSSILTLGTNLVSKLKADILLVHVQSITSTAAVARQHVYPDLRYVRFLDDGWQTPCTSGASIKTLAATVDQLRNYLKMNFGLNL